MEKTQIPILVKLKQSCFWKNQFVLRSTRRITKKQRKTNVR